MPILSRKPLSPIKNKGIYPDLGEINTLLRIYSISKIISILSNCECQFIILSDGNKYRRACLTNKKIVDDYQKSLKYWIDKLKLSQHIKLIDYEEYIHSQKTNNLTEERNFLYNKKLQELSNTFDNFFNPKDLNTLTKLYNLNSLSHQLHYTFWSIITSVNYNNLFSIDNDISLYKNNEIQNFYISFISSLHLPVEKAIRSHIFRKDIIGEISHYKTELLVEMRKSAWEAAKRYVAISLTDRELNLLNINNNLLKFTIHGKSNEFNFISTNRKNISITAQHSVAGFDFTSGEVNYKYRIEREHNLEQAIYIKNSFSREFNPLDLISNINQPIFYSSTTGVNNEK